MKRKVTLIQVLFLCVFVVCGIFIAKYYHDKDKTEKEMADLREEVSAEVPEDKYVPPEEEEYMPPTPEPREPDGTLSRYHSLYERNNDMAGWIKVYDTVIDYPVLHSSESNAYYLHRNFDKQYSAAGSAFLDCQCDRIGECDNMIIYGHNMRNGTMFHQLLNYASADYLQKHKYISFDTMYSRCVYEVFAVFRTSVGSANEFKYGEFVTAESEDAYNAFIDECIRRSSYKTGPHPSYREKLLTLSTCSYSSTNERFVVVSRLVEKN